MFITSKRGSILALFGNPGLIWALIPISGLIGLSFGFGARIPTRERVRGWIYGLLMELVEDLASEVKEKPELASDFLKPLIPALLKGIGLENGPEQMKDLKIGGFKIPAWLVQLGIQYMGTNGKQTAKEAVLGALS